MGRDPPKSDLGGKRERKNRDDWGAGGDPIGAVFVPAFDPPFCRPLPGAGGRSPKPPSHLKSCARLRHRLPVAGAGPGPRYLFPLVAFYPVLFLEGSLFFRKLHFPFKGSFVALRHHKAAGGFPAGVVILAFPVSAQVGGIADIRADFHQPAFNADVLQPSLRFLAIGAIHFHLSSFFLRPLSRKAASLPGISSLCAW